MAATSNGNPVRISTGRDSEGHRTIKAVYNVECAVTDGPMAVMEASGLPATGASWGPTVHSFTSSEDDDTWLRCWPTCRVVPKVQGKPAEHYEVEKTFTTKPLSRCQDNAIENPLSEPAMISGSFLKYTEETQFQADTGDPVQSSSHERLVGPETERDYNRPLLNISINTSTLPLDLITGAIDTVNDAELYGLSPRMMKLDNAPWSRKLYGTCTYYYTIEYQFSIDFDTFDRTVLDEGNLVLMSGGDYLNPLHFEQAEDDKGNNIRVILDGSGQRWDGSGSPGEIEIKKYSYFSRYTRISRVFSCLYLLEFFRESTF